MAGSGAWLLANTLPKSWPQVCAGAGSLRRVNNCNCKARRALKCSTGVGISVAISRCTNNFGPHQADEKFIPTVIRCALADKAIPIYAQGKNKRDWLFVTDHADALELFLAQVWVKGECPVFHVSADCERTNIDVAHAILTELKKPASLLSFVQDRPGHDWRYALDSSQSHAIGWKPAVSFEEGLRTTVAWYRSR